MSRILLLRHPKWVSRCFFLSIFANKLQVMFVRQKKNKSGSTSVVVVRKDKGRYKLVKTMGSSSDPQEIDNLSRQGEEWIRRKSGMADMFTDAEGKDRERKEIERFIDSIENILVNGDSLILDRIFDRIGFDKIEDDVFRKLVVARLSCPSSKAATVEYLKNHFDEDVDLSKIYRYLDKLNHTQQEKVQDISVRHTRELLGGNIGVMFYDVTTLYFEADREDDLRKTGFSKEGRHKNPQIILGLLVSLNGYPLAYCIHEGNKYEGHTMMPVIEEFVRKYEQEDFVVVADSGLMNEQNVADLERNNYKYIIGARIKTESTRVTEWILSHSWVDGQMEEYDKGDGRRLLVGYTDNRARKDSYNREKGVRRLEKAYRNGRLSKENINRRGYNKFLEMKNKVEVSINYGKIEEDAVWDGLKGYLTNTELPAEQIYAAYHNLWTVELAFRIAKSKLEVRPMFHFTRKRIEAHICICFVALKVYKELDRILKLNGIKLSIDKVLRMAKTVTTMQVRLPLNGQLLSRTMVMKRHKPIEKLFDENFWVSQ